MNQFPKGVPPLIEGPSTGVDNSLCCMLGDVLYWRSAEIIEEALHFPQRRLTDDHQPVNNDLANDWLVPVLGALAGYLREEGRIPMALDALNIHAGLHQDVPGLSHVFECLQQVLEDRLAQLAGEGAWSAAAVVRAGNLLHTGLSSIAFASFRHHHQQQAELESFFSHRFAQFGYSLGHDLRQPLQTLEVCSALLRRQPALPREEAKYCAELIEGSIARMSELLHDLKTLAASAQARADDGWIGFDDVIDEIGSHLGIRDAAHRMKVTCADLPNVEFRRLPLQLTLLSLVSSGLRGNTSGEIEHPLEVSATWEISARPPWGTAEIRVKDRGNDLFEAPRDALASEGSGTEGTKAYAKRPGLWLTRQILGVYGGGFSFMTSPGEGTVFVLRLEGRFVGVVENKGPPQVDDLFSAQSHGSA